MLGRTRIARAAAVAAVGLLTAGLAAPSAMAYPNATCDGDLGVGPWQNVTVAKGKTCTMGSQIVPDTPTRIYGDVKVSEDARLFVLFSVDIFGTLTATKATGLAVISGAFGHIGEVKVTETKGNFSPGGNFLCATVGHDVVIQNSAPTSRWLIGNSTGDCAGMHVGHDLTLQANRAELFMWQATVDGDIAVQKNTGMFSLRENSAQGNITVKGNKPTDGSGLDSNVAGGICRFQDNSPLVSGVFNLDVNGLLNSCNTND